MSKHKHLETAFIAVLIIANTHIVQSAYADNSVNREWTKEYILSLIGGSTNFPVSEETENELNRLENEVDSVSQYLLEIFEEDIYGEGVMVANTLLVMSYTKNNHELFANAISNKLESVQGKPGYEVVGQAAVMAFERMKQTRENANANIPVDGMNPAPNADSPQTNAAPVSENSTSSANLTTQDEPAQNEEPKPQPKRKPWLWFLTLPVVAGIAWRLWMKKN